MNHTLLVLACLISLTAESYGSAPAANPAEIIPGQVLVQFRNSYRYSIEIDRHASPSAPVRTGLARTDELGVRFGVYRIEKVIADPRIRQEADDCGLDRLYLVFFPDHLNSSDVAAAYKNLAEVEEAWPNLALPIFERPNDPKYGWHIEKTGLPGAWDVTHGDSSIVVCCIDGGVDWVHEDLEPNLWINPQEDINHNGRFDNHSSSSGGDLNGVDDGGNGYVDDVIGWNFKRGKPDPTPDPGDPMEISHGTAVLGAAVGATNNGKGVAGAGWNCRGMAVNCAQSAGSINATYAIQAIQYAANNGARVISMSFGGSGFSLYTGVLRYAKNRGCLNFGAAGNENVEVPSYPGADPYAIAVAATDQSDHRAGFSNFGTWVDICAPGTGIQTLSVDNGYWAPDGTSFSCPLTAGIAALLWAAHPALTPDQVAERLFDTCTPMTDALFSQGKLGAGRVNAQRAIVPLSRSYLTVTNAVVNDPAGNNDGVADPGETVNLVVTLFDSTGWQKATGISATLSTNDKTVTLAPSSAPFPDIVPGASGSNSGHPFVLNVDADALPHKILLVLNKQSTPASYDRVDTIPLNIGKPRVLLVDDDGGKDYERWYKAPLDTLGLLYTAWTVKTQGEPALSTLKNYSTVIWFTGDESSPALTATEIAALGGYLDGGGRLFISGQNIGQSISADPFYARYLHAQFQTPSTGKVFLVGTGDPISGRDTLAIAGNGGANNATSNDGIAPIAPAQTIFTYKDTDTPAAVRFDSTFQVIYFAFPFEAIDGPVKYFQRTPLLRRILVQYREYPVAEKTVDPVPAPGPISVAPNPFRRSALVRFSIPGPTYVTVNVFDAAGSLVRTLVSESKVAGTYSVPWNGRDRNDRPVPAGVYFCRLHTGFTGSVEKAVLLP